MRCPYCGEENQNGSKECAVCGRPLTQPNRPAPGQEGARPRAERPPQTPNASRPQPNRIAPAANAARPRPTAQGRPVNRPVQQRPAGRPPVRKKPKTRWNPKFLAACAGILLVLILIPILIAIAVHHGDSIESRQIQMFYSGHSGKTSIVLNGKVYDKNITGKVAQSSCSRDGLVQAALTESGELYYITGQKMNAVASNVQSFVLSADGSKLAYLVQNPPDASDTSESSTEEETTTARSSKKTQKQEETTESTTEYVPAGAEAFLTYADTSLYLFNGLDSAAPMIASHVSADSVSLSPTGASMAYTVTADDGESFEGFVYNGETPSSLGRNVLPIASSDDCQRIYYIKFDKMEEVWIQKLFARNGENEIKLDEFVDGNKLSVYLNTDYSQIVYSITGKSGAYFFCGADGEKSKLSGGYTPIYPYGQRETASGKVILTPYETFSKTVFRNAAGAAQQIDGKYLTVDLGASGTMFRVSPDGKTVYYLDENESLNSCVMRKIVKKEIAQHVMTFELSPDGEYLYYVDSDNKLHCVKGSKDTPVADDVYTSKTVGLAVTESGHVYFLQDYAYGSGTLCYLKGDGAIHVCSDINNVHDLAADTGEYIYFRSDFGQITGTYDLYYGKGKKYTRLFEKMG